MINLCHFSIIVAGVTYPAAVEQPLVFTPRTAPGSHPAFPVLLGFERFRDPFTGLYEPGIFCVLPEGEDVIVPRFAPAVGWAHAAGLVPFCVPLSGLRQTDGSFVCDELEPAPEGLEVRYLDPDAVDIEPGEWGSFGEVRAPDILVDYQIQRATPGAFVVQVADGPDLAPVPVEQQALRLEDGTVTVPALAHRHIDAILVNQDGRIVDAVAAAYPSVAVLVTDIVRPGQRTRLFQVR